MDMRVTANSWVEIHQILLKPEERAPGIPEETKQVPLELRVKGYLMEEAVVGDLVKIKTPMGRLIEGRLMAVNPPFLHDFGAPVPELLPIGQEIKAILQEGGHHDG